MRKSPRPAPQHKTDDMTPKGSRVQKGGGVKSPSRDASTWTASRKTGRTNKTLGHQHRAGQGNDDPARTRGPMASMAPKKRK
jgi:hypothetical protein